MNTSFSFRFQSVLGISMLVLVLLSAIAFGANRPIWWSLMSMGVFFIFVAQVVLSFTQPVNPQIKKLAFPAVLFLVVALWGWIQTIVGVPQAIAHPFWNYVADAKATISADPGEGRHAVMRLLCYGMIFITLVWACFEKSRAIVVLAVIALFSTGLAIFGMYAVLSGSNAVLGGLADPGVVKGTFVNRNNYATYAVFGVLANLAMALHLADQKSTNLRDKIEGFFGAVWIFALGFIICLTALALTQSRAGAAAGLVGLIVFTTTRYSGGRWKSSLMALLVLLAVGFVAATNSTGLWQSYLGLSTNDSRFTIYPAVVDAIADRPLLGHGYGAFHDAFRIYLPESAAFGDYVRAHNTYLELAFGLGVSATAALLLAFGIVTFYIYRGTKVRKSERVFSCFAMGCIATAAFHSFFDFSLQIPAVAALFAVILGLGYAQSFSSRQPKQTAPILEPVEIAKPSPNVMPETTVQ